MSFRKPTSNRGKKGAKFRSNNSTTNVEDSSKTGKEEVKLIEEEVKVIKEVEVVIEEIEESPPERFEMKARSSQKAEVSHDSSDTKEKKKSDASHDSSDTKEKKKSEASHDSSDTKEKKKSDETPSLPQNEVSTRTHKITQSTNITAWWTSLKSKTPESSAAMYNLSKAERMKNALMGAIKGCTVATEFEKTPYRCAVLRANYSWTVTILLLMFFFSASTYYGEEPIKCIDRRDRTPATAEQLDICIHFPFTRLNHLPNNDSNKTFALHYLWTHWMFILAAFVYKIVDAVCYLCEDKVLADFIKSLKMTQNYNTRYSLAKAYFQEHYGNHRGMFSRIVFLHLVALVINTAVFFMIDAFLNFNYMKLPLRLLDTRDFEKFDDPMSLLFPPFVQCEISPIMHILKGRTYFFGCHLPLMEIYEKFFMGFWFWQVGLAFSTVLSMFSWITSGLLKESFLNAEELKNFKETTKSLKRLPINEVFALNMVKPYLFGSHFRTFVFALAKWNRAEENFVWPESDFVIFMPSIRKNMSLIEEDDDALPALVDDIFQTAADVGDQQGWRRNLKVNTSYRPKPSAPTQKNDEKQGNNDTDSW